MNRAKRQTQPTAPQRTVVSHAQLGGARPLVVDLGGWCITVRTAPAPPPHAGPARLARRPR